MKRRIATLAIVGAMAVAAVAPATVFASPANNQTTVGYVPGGTSIGELDAVVVVPKDTVFDKLGQEIEGFDVEALKLDSTGAYTAVSSNNALDKDITVKVASANKGVLKKASAQSTDPSLAYDYFVGASLSQKLDLDGDPSTEVEVGIFDADTYNSSIEGKLKLTDTAELTDEDFGKPFTDVLTYTFYVDGVKHPAN